MEGQALGVKLVCEKYGISRTLYYRWLNRYKEEGLNGLICHKRNFTPKNKIPYDLESRVLACVRLFPSYGPKALYNLLEGSGVNISESAIYNILKRHQLNHKKDRLRYKKRNSLETITPIDLTNARSGSLWSFWVTPLGDFKGLGPLFVYTFMDCASRIACSRIYKKLSLEALEDLLSSVAIPVALSIHLKPDHLLVDFEDPLHRRFHRSFNTAITKHLESSGLPMTILSNFAPDSLALLNQWQQAYNHTLLNALLVTRPSLDALRSKLQVFLRDYNLTYPVHLNPCPLPPLGYHNKHQQKEAILPLWAFIDRPYE